MGIEKDIKQQKFKSEHHKALINLIYTYNYVMERLKSILDTEEVTVQQYNILRILRGSNKPLSTMQIRDRMLDKMSDTSRIVDRLVIKELAQKTICTADKRLVDITITDKGRVLLHELDSFEPEMERIMKSLTDDEAVMFNNLLDKIRQ